MVIAIMNSEHFDFLVVEETKEKAEKLMNKKFHKHLKQYLTKWQQEEKPTEYYGCNFIEDVAVGGAYRDLEKL